MRCEQVREQLADYLVESLDEAGRAAIQAHLNACAACREETEMWARLGQLPEERPSPMLRRRFEAVLESYEEGLAQQPARGRGGEGARGRWGAGATGRWTVWLRPGFALASVAASLVVGILLGHVITLDGQGRGEITQLQKEVHSMRQMVALSLMQQQSASERLRGVNWSYRVDRPDREVVAALLRTLKYDLSADVRLAALDALHKTIQDPAVREGLVDALGRQESPLVQMALIEMLAEARERKSVDALRRLRQERGLDQAVRERIDWALEQLR